MLCVLDTRNWSAEDFDKGLYSYKEARKTRVKVKGVPCMYVRCRLDIASLPEGFRMYEVGTDRRGNGSPSLVRKFVSWPFFGTLVTKQELPLDNRDRSMRFGLNEWQWVRNAGTGKSRDVAEGR